MAHDRRYFGSTGLRYDVARRELFLDVPIAIAVVHGPLARARRSPSERGRRAASARHGSRRSPRASACTAGSRQQTIARAGQRERPEPTRSRRSTSTCSSTPARRRPGSPRSWTRRPSARRRASVRRSKAPAPRRSSRPSGRRLGARGVSAYAVDVTSPDVARPRAERGARRRSRALRARRLPSGTVPRRHPAVHRRIRGRARRRAARAARSEPAPASVPVSGPRTPGRRRTAPTRCPGEPLSRPIGWRASPAPTDVGADPTEDYHEASRMYPGVVDPHVVGAARLERSVDDADHARAVRSSATSSGRSSAARAARLGQGEAGGRRSARRSHRAFGAPPLGLDELATILQAALRRHRDSPGTPQTLRCAPSGGALYPLELYVACHRVEGSIPRSTTSTLSGRASSCSDRSRLPVGGRPLAVRRGSRSRARSWSR